MTVPAWRSETALWSQAVRSEPTNAFAHLCLAQSLGTDPAAQREYFRALICDPAPGLRHAAWKNLAYLHHAWRHPWKAGYWKGKAKTLET